MVSAARPLERERRLLLATLLALAAAGWVVVVWHAVTMDRHHEMGMAMGGGDLTMGMGAPLFLSMWVAMMVAMMFPASAPMMLAYARSQSRRRQDGGSYVPVWWFIAPYVATWTAFGVLGYLLALLFESVAGDSTWASGNLPRIAGALLVAAGVYQLTPLKRICLSRCRSPLSFMLSYWRDGRSGALSMGLRHGLYCIGCCWVLFVILLPLGVMNVAAMVVVAALVFAEKALPAGERVASIAAALLIAYGVVAIFVPDVLPVVV